jgi:putative solute:sodium symporter small subunit
VRIVANWGAPPTTGSSGFSAKATPGAIALGYSKWEGNSFMSQTTKDTSANDQAHWRKTTNLMWTHLAIWFFFGYVIHFFAPALNKIVIFGFPLGFYMAAQGSLIAFVVQLFLFAKQQDKIDREFGVAED